MASLISKGLALLVAIGYVVTIAVVSGAMQVFEIVIYLVMLPLPCILIPDVIRDFPALVGADSSGPPGLIVFVGWVLLLLPGVLGLIYATG